MSYFLKKKIFSQKCVLSCRGVRDNEHVHSAFRMTECILDTEAYRGPGRWCLSNFSKYQHDLRQLSCLFIKRGARAPPRPDEEALSGGGDPGICTFPYPSRGFQSTGKFHHIANLMLGDTASSLFQECCSEFENRLRHLLAI